MVFDGVGGTVKVLDNIGEFCGEGEVVFVENERVEGCLGGGIGAVGVGVFDWFVDDFDGKEVWNVVWVAIRTKVKRGEPRWCFF